MTALTDTFRAGLDDSIATLQRLRQDDSVVDTLAALASRCVDALRAGNKLLFAGNGGSAADAQHWAAELVSRFNYDRPGLAAIALTTDTSALTAIGNDYGFDYAFARQVEALGRKGDVLIGISTSGNSPNVLRALKAARDLGMVTAGFTGAGGGQMPGCCDLLVRVPADRTPLIQEGHAALGHLLCAVIESNMHPRAAAGA